jgi:DMSO/TMAO reductase YedYZ heme-binding membrane subunit
MANPTKLANCFLLQNRRWAAQNYAKLRASLRSFCTFYNGAAKERSLKFTRRPRCSNYVAGVKLDFLVLIVSPKHYKMVTSSLTYREVN